ncbi:MAG: hypothetical protein PSN36_01930, partial [Gammaproteobacteria bacterium]|nr:hypothetical protein [Gammaproteobacteria bacterium]
MPITELDKELTKLSRLKIKFNGERKKYDHLQREFEEYMKPYLGNNKELTELQKEIMATNEMNLDDLWRRYNELLQRKYSDDLSKGEKKILSQLEQNDEIMRFKSLERQINLERDFMDVRNVIELEEYMKGSAQWIRYKELSDKGDITKEERKELKLLSQQPDINRMLAAKEGEASWLKYNRLANKSDRTEAEIKELEILGQQPNVKKMLDARERRNM